MSIPVIREHEDAWNTFAKVAIKSGGSDLVGDEWETEVRRTWDVVVDEGAKAHKYLKKRGAEIARCAADAAAFDKRRLTHVETRVAPLSTVVGPGVLGGDGGTPRAVAPPPAPSNPPDAVMADPPPAATEEAPDAMTDESVEEEPAMGDAADPAARMDGQGAHALAPAALPDPQAQIAELQRRLAASEAALAGAQTLAAERSRANDLASLTLPPAAHRSFALTALRTGVATELPDAGVVTLGRDREMTPGIIDAERLVSRTQIELTRRAAGGIYAVSNGRNASAVVTRAGAIVPLSQGAGMDVAAGDTLVLRAGRLLRDGGALIDEDEAFTLVDLSTALRDNLRLQGEVADALARADGATAREEAAASRAAEAAAAEARANERADAAEAEADELRARLEAAEKARADAEEARDAAEQRVAAMLANPVQRDGVDAASRAARSGARSAASTASAREAEKKTPTKGPRGKRQAKGQNV